MQEDIFKTCGLRHFSVEFKTNFSEWFTGEDGGDKDIIEARQQAVEAYPAFAYEIYKEREIREAVEKKKPLAPVLAEYLKVDEKRLKRLQGKNVADFAYAYDVDILKLTEKNFQKIKNNLLDLNIFYGYGSVLYQMSIHEFLDYLSLQNSNPCKYIERMKKTLSDDVFDGFNFLRTRLFLPALLNKIKSHAEKNNLIFCNSSEWSTNRKEIIKYTHFKTILDFSERYHRNLFRWEDMFNFDFGMNHISWQPMFGEIDLGNDWTAREIHSISKLKEQGQRENHCVGGYVGSILEGDKKSARLIFSLEKEGQVKSTIDILCFLNEEEDGLDVKIQQNRAHSNENPSQETLNFSHHLVEIIKKQPISKLNIYLDNLDIVREEYLKYKTQNEYLSTCGYNPWDRKILENVWDEFKPVLPTKIRRLDLDEFIEMMSLDDVDFRPRKNSDELNPWDMMENKESIQINDNEIDADVNI